MDLFRLIVHFWFDFGLHVPWYLPFFSKSSSVSEYVFSRYLYLGDLSGVCNTTVCLFVCFFYQYLYSFGFFFLSFVLICRGMPVLFIFSRNQHFVWWTICIVILISTSFISALISIFFRLLAALKFGLFLFILDLEVHSYLLGTLLIL